MKQYLFSVDCGSDEGLMYLGPMIPPDPEWPEAFVRIHIQREREAWREANPYPDTDDEFIGWLEAQGWKVGTETIVMDVAS